jgi:outer membrane lipoprotein SlyB
MPNRSLPLICAIAFTSVASCAAQGQRAGQSATVQFGVVRSAEEVTLDSRAAQGALVGGTLGIIGGRGNSTAGNAIRGATLGGASKAAAEGDRSGMAFTVGLPDGSSTRVVTDQREIRVGDCVAVERAGNTANIRRVSASYCDPANGQAVQAVEDHTRSEAIECQSAKQELAEATSNETVELAARKVELLCNG